MHSVIARLLAACVVGSCLSACGVDPQADIASDGTALTSSEESSSGVYVLGSGSWGTYVYHGVSSQSFWVDLSVRNDAFTKDVGIVWSSDGWATSHWTRAVYEGPLAGGRERWGLDVRDFGHLGWGPNPQVEYAAFATMGGRTHWSPFRNHFIYQPVTLDRPIRLLSSRITSDGSGLRLEGDTRSLRTATARRVFVRYTLDHWATWSDVEASASGAEHAFSIPLAIDAQSTEEVEFAVRLETGGQSAWDSAEGANYRHRLAPQVTTSLTNAPDYAIDGIVLLSGNASTAIPVERVLYRIDQQPWVELEESEPFGYFPGNGFSATGSLRAILETSTIGGGAHTIDVQVQAGPFWRQAPPLQLGVADLLASVGSRALSAADLGTVWDVDSDPAGNLVVGGDRGVARLDASGALDLAFEPMDGIGYIGDVEVTAGFVYGLATTRLWRWDAASGAVDRSFGVEGVIELAGASLGGTPVCYTSHFAATDDALFITDSCNSRLLRLALDGSFVDAISVLGDAAWATVLSPVVDGDSVWVVRSTYDGTSITDLVQIAASAGAPLSEVQIVRLDSRLLYTPQGFAVAEDAFWVTSGEDLRRFGRGGALEASWLGGGVYEIEVDGGLSIGRRVDVLADGSVEVLSVQNSTLERFAPIAH